MSQHRASLYEAMRIGREVTPGTAVPALNDVASFGINVGPRSQVGRFRPRGSKLDGLTTLEREWSEGPVDGKLTYTEFAWLLMLMYGMPTFSQPAGFTEAHLLDFAINATRPDNLPTLTVEQGSEAWGAARIVNVFLSALSVTSGRTTETTIGGTAFGAYYDEEGVDLSGLESQTLSITGDPEGGTFTLTFDGQTTAGIAYNAAAAAVQSALEGLSNIAPGDVQVSGTAMPDGEMIVRFRGQYEYETVPAMTGSAAGLTGGTTPAVVIAARTEGAALTVIDDIMPVKAGDITVYLDDEYEDIGTTPMDTLSSSWSISNRQAAVWKQNANYPSFRGKVETAPTFDIRTRVELNTLGKHPYQLLSEGKRAYMRWEARGATPIDADEPDTRPRITLDFPVAVSAVGERGDTEGLWAVEYTFSPLKDSEMGNRLVAQMVTTLGSL